MYSIYNKKKNGIKHMHRAGVYWTFNAMCIAAGILHVF